MERLIPKHMPAEVELNRHRWADLRVCEGRASAVPEAARGLMAAKSADEAEQYYWQLENRVVVQGQLYNSAPPLVSVLTAALLDELERPAKIGILDLLYQIVSGESHPDEVGAGNPDLGWRCRHKAREGIWVFYRELLIGESAAAWDVLEVIDEDAERLAAFSTRRKLGA
ncbi:hypothetical protein ABZT47_33135 [Sphaerisporangium sp. NPDC005289]|uniref:hypothetical protein n=1 Tax=Sphaerisporangium sp. NPDC005289 TaxID=3155247 RepID=UPI0033B4205C